MLRCSTASSCPRPACPNGPGGAAATLAGVLRLNDDRSVDLTFDDGTEVHLTPPTIGQWRKIREAYRAADDGWADVLREHDEAVATTPDGEQAPDKPVPADYLYSDANPYGAAFAVMVDELSTSRPDADSLPLWATEPSIFTALFKHWRTVNVERVQPPTAPAQPEPPFDPVAAGLAEQPARPLPKAVQGALAQQTGA